MAVGVGRMNANCGKVTVFSIIVQAITLTVALP